MEGVEGVIRLMLEKSWAVGVLLIATSAFGLMAERHGVILPSTVHDYEPVALLVGVALVTLSVVNGVLSWCGSVFRWMRQNARRAANADREAELVWGNMQTLDPQEARMLLEMVQSQLTSFEIDDSGVAGRLVRKAILTRVHRVDVFNSICRLHEAVEGHRAELAEKLRRQLA